MGDKRYKKWMGGMDGMLSAFVLNPVVDFDYVFWIAHVKALFPLASLSSHVEVI